MVVVDQDMGEIIHAIFRKGRDMYGRLDFMLRYNNDPWIQSFINPSEGYLDSSNAPTLGMEDITERFKAVRAQQIPPEQLKKINKQKSVQFKASLAIIIGFFLWLTCVFLSFPH